MAGVAPTISVPHNLIGGEPMARRFEAMSDETNPRPVFERAAEFVSEMWKESGPSSEMHVGDLAWGTFRRWPSALQALRLWPDIVGQTQVLTMFDGSGVCDFVVRPGRSGLEAAMRALEWAERTSAATAVGSGPIDLRVGRRLQSTEIVELLHARGFERRSIGVPAMSRTIAGADVASPSTPSEYAIRELHTDDFASRVLAFNAAFPGEELCVDAYRALRACPSYNPRLDVVATTPSSEVAAFATLWFDTHNGVVHIEPAGCHPDHRRLGLTRAVILQALRWSVELGATGALVRHVSTNTAAQALYESCGFATICQDTGFIKTIPQPDFG
jgi:ribosomal protein S18 acetylase RimI-like enzyme